MTADKRTVTTDALETLGTILTNDEKRDAIHLAVEPVIAKQRLKAGQHVGADGSINNPVGIVDPFLTAPVYPGQKFWLVVYPRKINSLRHVWTHPAFPDVPEVAATSPDDLRVAVARARMEDFADEAGISYNEILWGAQSFIRSGEYMVEGGRWESFGLSDPEEFWKNYEIVTGETVPENDRHSFFSCSC